MWSCHVTSGPVLSCVSVWGKLVNYENNNQEKKRVNEKLILIFVSFSWLVEVQIFKFCSYTRWTESHIVLEIFLKNISGVSILPLGVKISKQSHLWLFSSKVYNCALRYLPHNGCFPVFMCELYVITIPILCPNCPWLS